MRAVYLPTKNNLIKLQNTIKQRKSGQNTSNLASWHGALADAPWSVGLHSTEYLPFLHVVFGDFPAENVPKNAKNRLFL